MLIYRNLQPIRALTFDLDDTLYDNRPVIENLEAEMLRWLHSHHPLSTTIPVTNWQQIKREVALANPAICHDVTLWRQTQLETGFKQLGYSPSAAKDAAEESMEQVLWLRNQIDVPDATHQVMAALASKYPLIAITNGNVDPEKIGLGRYFQAIYQAGPDGRAKPFSDMFQQSASFLGIAPAHILHVGDHLQTDVIGAKNAGFQACWSNYSDKTLKHQRKARILPDIEIRQLTQLLLLC